MKANQLPEIFDDVGNEAQFLNASNYREWVIGKSCNIFGEDIDSEALKSMMLVHQILFPQIKRMKFSNQLKMVLKMNFSLVRSQRVRIEGIFKSAAIDVLEFKEKIDNPKS